MHFYAYDGQVNTYSYVNGNPVSFTDPLGLYRLGGKNTTEGIRIELHSALLCFDFCTRRETVVTSLTDSHSGINAHSRGEACDMGRRSNSGLSRDEAARCFGICFPAGSLGQEEYNSGTDPNSGTHFHLQLPPDIYAPGLPPPQFLQGIRGNRRF